MKKVGVPCTPMMVIVSPTSQPPISSATFQFGSQSLRLILVCALKPALNVPQGVLACPAYSTSSTTGFVMSRMVNGVCHSLLDDWRRCRVWRWPEAEHHCGTDQLDAP